MRVLDFRAGIWGTDASVACGAKRTELLLASYVIAQMWFMVALFGDIATHLAAFLNQLLLLAGILASRAQHREQYILYRAG